MRQLWGFLVALAMAFLFSQTAIVATATCESIASFAWPNTTITLAQTVSTSAFTPPAPGASTAEPLRDLPPFCRAICQEPPCMPWTLSCRVTITAAS